MINTQEKFNLKLIKKMPLSNIFSTSAFTLVELMIVIAILGVLAATVVPSFTKYKIEAMKAEAFQFVPLLAQAQQTFYIENGYFCTLGDNGRGADESNRDYIEGGVGSGAQIPFPAATGTKVHFAYAIFAGEEGNATAEPLIEDGSYVKCKPYIDEEFTVLSFPTTTNGVDKQCGLDVGGGTNVGLDSSPSGQYDWVFLVAKQNLYRDLSNRCTVVYKLVETYNGSLDFQSSPVISYDFAGIGGSGDSSSSSDSSDSGDSGDSGSRGSGSGR